MRKKIFLVLSMVFVLACMLAFTASADSVHEGKVDLSATVTLDDGTVCNLFDSEGNALIWYLDANSELQSIRADDSRVKYKATYKFNVGNSTVGSVAAYEVSDMWIALESGNINKGNIVVLNLMDDDVLINEATNSSYLNNPVNCVKTIQWANKVLEYAYLRLDTVAIQQQAFNGCNKLKYVNVADLAELRAIGGGNAFGGCPLLFAGQTLDLTKTKLVTINGNGAFNYIPVTEIKLPSTLTQLDAWNIQGTAVVSFAFPTGVATITGSQFNDCKSLTTIYINNTTTKIEDRAFNNTALEKVFFVGTLDELNALLDNTGANNNAPFWDVVGENRANLISYADYKALENKSGEYVVYGYSYCEAYNEGKHTMSGNATLQFNGYFNEITFADTCSVEGCGAATIDTEKTIGAIFVDYGYSCTEIAINGSYSVSQFFGINQGALADYVGATGNTVEYGLVVSTSDNPLAAENSGLIAEGKTYITAQDKFEHDYFAINVIGITDGTIEGTKDTRESVLTFCAYVIDNGTVYYLDGGKTLNVAEQKSYSDVLASQQ